ncbi:hypothetical protein CsSME_00010816 [Camellia sinensis var. sinensis]
MAENVIAGDARRRNSRRNSSGKSIRKRNSSNSRFQDQETPLKRPENSGDSEAKTEAKP